MPTELKIPAQTERHCAPCKYHKMTAALMGGPGNVWRQYACMHQDAFGDMKLSDDQAIRDKQIELRGRLLEHGRDIGKTERQPEWCPLRRSV